MGPKGPGPMGPGPMGPGPLGPKNDVIILLQKHNFWKNTFFEEIDLLYDHPSPKPGRKWPQMDYLVTSFSSKCQRFLGKSWIFLQFLMFFRGNMSDFMKKSFFDLIELLVRFWRFCVFPCARRPAIIFSKLWPPYWFWCLFVFFWGLLCLFALSWVQGPWAHGPWAQGPWAQGNFLHLSTPLLY